MAVRMWANFELQNELLQPTTLAGDFHPFLGALRVQVDLKLPNMVFNPVACLVAVRLRRP